MAEHVAIQLGDLPGLEGEQQEIPAGDPERRQLLVGVGPGLGGEERPVGPGTGECAEESPHAVEEAGEECLGGRTTSGDQGQFPAGDRLDEALAPDLRFELGVEARRPGDGGADHHPQGRDLHDVEAEHHHRPLDRGDLVAPAVRRRVGQAQDPSSERRVDRHRPGELGQADIGPVAELDEGHRGSRHRRQVIQPDGCYHFDVTHHGASLGSLTVLHESRHGDPSPRSRRVRGQR